MGSLALCGCVALCYCTRYPLAGEMIGNRSSLHSKIETDDQPKIVFRISILKALRASARVSTVIIVVISMATLLFLMTGSGVQTRNAAMSPGEPPDLPLTHWRAVQEIQLTTQHIGKTVPNEVTTVKNAPKIKLFVKVVTSAVNGRSTRKTFNEESDTVISRAAQTETRMHKLASSQRHLGNNLSFLRYAKISKNVTPTKGGNFDYYEELQAANDSRLVNLTDFKYLLNNEDICSPTREPPFMIVLVHSAVGNRGKRDGIRESWGRRVPVLFLLGAAGGPEGPGGQARLRREHARHHDLVQGSFIDTYRNLTYKHAMALKWAVTRCPSARYLVKMDDDGFLNVPYLLGTLHHLAPGGARNLLACNVFLRSRVMRSGKWSVTREEYPRSLYPTYCNGWFIVYSLDVALRLYQESLRHKYFWIDDVHFTGTLAKVLGIQHSQLNTLIESYSGKFQNPRTSHILASFPLNGALIKKMTQHFSNSLSNTSAIR